MVGPIIGGWRVAPGMNFQSVSSFHNPLQTYVFNPGRGLHLPREVRDPFLAQQGMSPIMSAFLCEKGSSLPTMTGLDPYATRAMDAMKKIGSDPDAAGVEFKQIRIDKETHDRGVGDDVYEIASFGEAIWGHVDAGTFNALRTVRLAADERKDGATLAREVLIRSVANAKVGDDEGALSTLQFAVSRDEMKSSMPLRIMSMSMYANVLVNQGFKYTGAKRDEALKNLKELMNETIPETIRAAKDDPSLAKTMEATLPDLYVYIAGYFLAQHRPMDAMSLVNTLRTFYPEHPKTRALFDGAPLVTGDGPGTQIRTPLQNLVEGQIKNNEESGQAFSHIRAGLAEFLRASSFPNNVAYWKSALLGAIPMAAAGSVYGLSSNNSFAAGLMGAGIGAAASVAASKIKLGATSEETRQAFISGYSDSKLGQVAFAESMKLLATYAFFGGALPLLNFAPDFVLASNGDFTGQLHGPGSVLSQVVSSMTERASQLVTSVSNTNLADGAAAFWDGWRASSPFAEAVHNGVTLPFSGPSEILSRVFQHSKELDKIVELFNKLPSDGLAGGAVSAGLAGLYSYMGAAGLYAVLSMNPTIAAGMKDKLPDNIDKWLFPGAYLGTGMAMVASGVKPISALAFTLVCYAVQYRHHVQSGGDWRIFKPDVFKTLDLSKFMRAGAIQLLYIGPGNAIKPDIPKIDWMASSSSEIANYLLANVEGHMGLVPFLAALGVFHAAFTGLNVKQTLKAKYAKAYTYEIPANVLKMILGWTSLAGNVAGTVIKEFGLGSIVTSTYREAGDSPVQRDIFRGMLKKMPVEPKTYETTMPEGLDLASIELYNQMTAEAFEAERMGTLAARAGDGVRFVNDNYATLPFQEKLIKLTSNYYIRPSESPLVGPRPNPNEYTDVIFRALTTTETQDEVVDNYLSRLSVMLKDLDPALDDVRHNFLVATIRASAGAAHGDRIKNFLNSEEIRSVIQLHGLTATYKKVAERWGTDGREAWKGLKIFPGSPKGFIAKYFRKPAASQDDRFYNAVTTAGRSFPFSGVVTGDSLIQYGAAFSSFWLSAVQGDPTFETKVDPTLFRGTLYKFLMTSPADVGMSTEKYRREVLYPMLSVISRVASRLDDSRFDIRHNLLTTVWLASHGPHSEVMKKWVEEHRYMYNAHGIYGKPKIGFRVVDLPRSLKESKHVKKLFKQYLIDSTNSVDGKVQYNMPQRAEPLRWTELEPPKSFIE